MSIDSKWEVRKGRITAWDRWCAELLVSLRKAAASPGLTLEELGLSIPQSACSFTFGSAKLALPVGAVFELWIKDPVANGVCPKCGGKVVATAFGGILNVGGYMGLCLKCATPMFRHIGGLGAVHQHITPFLEGTPWYLNGATYGGSFSSDGKALAKVLHLPDPPKATRSDKPEVTVGKHRLEVPDVEIVR
jgi:hypothetical protein